MVKISVRLDIKEKGKQMSIKKLFAKKKKNTENDISFKRTWQNMFYAFSIVWKACPWLIIYEMVFSLLSAVVNFLTGTWMTRYIFNAIQRDLPFERIIYVVVVIFISNMLFYVCYHSMFRLARPIMRMKVTKALNHMLFGKVAKVDLSCYENTEFYQKFTMTVPEAMGGVQDYVLSLLSDVLYSVTSIAGNVSMILIIDPVLIVLAFVPLLSNLFFAKPMNRLDYKYQMQMREIKRDKDYVDRVFSLADYAKEMRMTNIHTVMMKRFATNLKTTQAAIAKYGFKTASVSFIKSLIVGTFVYYSGIIYAAYRLLVSKSILIGDCIVISGAVSGLSGYLGWVTSTYQQMNKHAMFLENLRGFMDYEIKIKSVPEAPKADRDNPVICFENMSFRYENTEKDVLKNIDLTVHKGEKIAVVGANGAGKSTLVKLMMRLYDATEGRVLCSGKDIRELDLDSYRSLYGVIFQDYRIFAMTVRDNVLLGEDGDDEKVIEALKAAGIYEKVMSLPDGIDTMLTREYDEDGAVLSGGEYQKICIARVFARNAPIVILDEPSSALDPIAEYEVYNNMLKVCEGRSVIFISHRLSSAVLADRVVMIDGGEIIECGSHTELMAKGGKYADMFAKQAENYAKGGSEDEDEE